MKAVNEMSYTELVEEVQYVASLLVDQPHHHGDLRHPETVEGCGYQEQTQQSRNDQLYRGYYHHQPGTM